MGSRKSPFKFLCALSVLCFWIAQTYAHVALTFPPARKYDLDFLDSSRTAPPCGMPKGNIKTTLLGGSRFNVTWHLGYPHMGGFKIQLLDHLDRPVLDLTPTIQGSEFVSNDATAQSFQVQLPSEFTCENCTLRLLRQALEWGPAYKFWSCADVDIKSKKIFRETCTDHGRNLVGRCKCDRLYSGNVCQFRDECVEDSDCGDHGKCINVNATTHPKNQCYCQLGWFGPGCNKRSPVRTTEIDFEIYTERKLSDTFRLYWRILKEHNEIEAIMVVTGTSYGAIGWRPKSLTKTCKNFPQIGPKVAVREFSSESEPGGKPEPSFGPKLTSEHEPSSEPEPTGGPEFYPEPSTEPDPLTSEPKPTNKHEASSEPEPISGEPEIRREPSAEQVPPTSEPVSTQNNKYRKSLYSRRSAPSTLMVRTSPLKDDEQTSISFQVSRKQDKSEDELLNRYTPRHDFSPMDCTDIIIGSAHGTNSRIADYYTRDRSTPRMDNYWGGGNDLTAAMGFEKDGVTTILFRKKLEAIELSDHAIENEMMHVIFAQGQEHGKYIHVPKSGIESAKVLDKDFYRPDELKYHGHKNQRGVVHLNFFEEKRIVKQGGASATSGSAENTGCGGIWKIPRNCNTDNYTCEYSAHWELIPRKDTIKFTITTRHTDTWTGIALSNDEKMSQTDAILGWVDKTGRPFLMDTWISGYTQPLLDASQNIFNMSGRIVDGVTTLSFLRKRFTEDSKDLAFTNDHCLFIMFPVRGGAFNSVNKKIRKHEVIPSISTERICINSCDKDENYDEYLTTTESPGIRYNVEVKLVDLGENFKIPKPGMLQYDDLTNSIKDSFRPVFTKLPGYRRVAIGNIRQSGYDIIATMKLQLENPLTGKSHSLTEDTNVIDEKVHKLLQESIGSGRVGNLKVDPKYLVFDPQSVTSNIISDSSRDHQNNFFNLTEAKLYIVLGCIAALGLVVLFQASCTIFRESRESSANHKDHLIPNSAWKDYSANTNYAFDAFEEEDKKMNSVKDEREQTETLPSKHKPHLQNPQGIPFSLPNQQPGSYIGDTRSLQRTRGPYPSTNMERTAFSLPRTAFDKNHRPGENMHPDFYFMPSQRKYSGEVVRVYVDYTNKTK